MNFQLFITSNRIACFFVSLKMCYFTLIKEPVLPNPNMIKSDFHLQALREGQESGLHHFMVIYGKPLRFFAYSLVRKKEVAEEVVSDVFCKLWNNRENFPSSQNVKAFLYIATRNACYDFLDSPKNKIQYDPEITDELAYPQKDFLSQIIEVELVELIYQEINNLPEQQATVFRMSYVEDLTTEEISDKLGISANAIFLARSRALAKLRVVFKDKKVLWYLLILLPLVDRWVN